MASDDYHFFTLSYLEDRALIDVEPNVYSGCRTSSPARHQAAADLVDALVGASGYDVTATPITLGGLTGWRIEGSASGGCGTYTAWWGYPVVMNNAPGAIHLIALDTRIRQTIVIDWSADDADALALAESVISSFEFAPTGIPSGPYVRRPCPCR